MKRLWRSHPNLVILAAVAIVLGAAEAVLQVKRPDLHDPTYFSAIGNPFKAYEEDRDLFWTRSFFGRPDLVRLSRARNRVYVVGGSIAVGMSEPFFAVLKDHGLFVDGFDLACGGWTSHQAVVQYRRFAALRPPTHAVLCNGYNDSRPALLDYAAQARLNRTRARRVLFELNKSRLFTLYRRGMLRALSRKDPKPGTVCVPLDQYRANLAEFVRLAREGGAVPVLVTQGFPGSRNRDQTAPYFAVMEEVARETGAVFADVRPAIAEANARLGIPNESADTPGFEARGSALWTDPVHLNDAGYRIEGEVIFQAVGARGGWK